MDKRKKYTLGGIGIVLIGVAIALILTQCHGNPVPSSSSSESTSFDSSSSSSESSSSSQSSSASESSSSSSEAAKHTVVFQNYDGSTILSYEVEEGTAITLPSTNPTREGEADLGYTFIGYAGYTPNMVVGTSDMTFVAEFELCSSGMVFSKNGTHAIFGSLSGFSSNRLVIPFVAEGVSLTEIAADAVVNQTTIDTVFIPTSITTIGANAFAGCVSIKHAYYLGSSASWQQMVVGSGNEALTDKVLFFSETQIAQGWHYVDEVATPWDAPFYVTTTLDSVNAPALSATSFSNASVTIDGIQLNYQYGKAVTGQHAFLSAMMDGTMFNDALTPFVSIAAITVTFTSTGADVTLNTGKTADSLSSSNSLVSGVRVEFSNSPTFFSLTVRRNASSMDFMNDGMTISSIVIEYSNIPAPAYPIYTKSADQTSYIVSSYTGNVVDLVIPTYYNGLPVTEIGAYAFQRCTSLITIRLPDTITKIGDNAFENCTSLTNFEVPPNLVSVGEFAFYCCSSITSMHFPESLESLGRFALSSLTSMSDITFAEGMKLTTFSSYTFTYCTFSTIRIPEGVIATGFDMFQSNSGLTTVYLPHSLITIADSTFNACPNIQDIYYAGSEAEWNAIPKYTNFSYDIGAAVIHFAA